MAEGDIFAEQYSRNRPSLYLTDYFLLRLSHRTSSDLPRLLIGLKYNITASTILNQTNIGAGYKNFKVKYHSKLCKLKDSKSELMKICF